MTYLSLQIKKLVFSGSRADHDNLWPPWGDSNIHFKNLKNSQWFHIMEPHQKTPGEQRILKKVEL